MGSCLASFNRCCWAQCKCCFLCVLSVCELFECSGHASAISSYLVGCACRYGKVGTLAQSF